MHAHKKVPDMLYPAQAFSAHAHLIIFLRGEIAIEIDIIQAQFGYS